MPPYPPYPWHAAPVSRAYPPKPGTCQLRHLGTCSPACGPAAARACPGTPHDLLTLQYLYRCSCSYEGLSRDAVPHGMGVMIFGNGTGGGLHFRDVRRGDK